jgi:hypothetical protein
MARRQNLAVSLHVSPALLIGVCRVDESGMIGNQMGKHTRTDMVAVYGTPYAIPHRKSDILFQSTFVEYDHFYFDENSLHALELYFDTNWR